MCNVPVSPTFFLHVKQRFFFGVLLPEDRGEGEGEGERDVAVFDVEAVKSDSGVAASTSPEEEGEEEYDDDDGDGGARVNTDAVSVVPHSVLLWKHY